MQNIQNEIQFKIIPTAHTENDDFKHKDYQSICIAVILGMHVFDCDVMGCTLL